MFEYFSEIKQRDEAAKQRFVVVATAISFIAIVAIWVPIRIAQWKTPTDSTLAKTQSGNSVATASPAVAGDSAVRIFTNVATPKPAATAVATPAEPLFTSPVVTATPAANSVSSPEITAPEATPSATDFPTL